MVAAQRLNSHSLRDCPSLAGARRLTEELTHSFSCYHSGDLGAARCGSNSRGGGWRILFSADLEAKALFVLSVETRGQVYQHS